MLFIFYVLLHFIAANSHETQNTDITWCHINWHKASRQLLDPISLKSKERDHAPLNIPTQYQLTMLTSEPNITINISVSFDKQYHLSSFPCDPNGLTLSIQKHLFNPIYTDIVHGQQIEKAAAISTNIDKTINNQIHKIIFQVSLQWIYTKWHFSNWNISLIFHESINNINISSQPITIMNVPQSFQVTGTNPNLKYLYGRYSLSVKAQFDLFSTINTNGVYFQDPSSGTTVFTFIYMSYVYALSQWVFFDNYGQLARPTIAANYSIYDNIFTILPDQHIFIDNDANEMVISFDTANGLMSDRIYNPYLECSVTQYLVNYLSAEGFIHEGFEWNLKTEFTDANAWYNIKECMGKRCVLGVRLNRFDHFLILEYNDYHYDNPRWKLIQSWMFCWSLEWWLSGYTKGSQYMNTTDELPTTIHYLPVSHCSVHQGNHLKKQYGANQLVNAETFEPWLNGLYLLINRVIEIGDDCELDPLVLSLSRSLWGAIGQCGRISYVDFDPQIYVYVVTEQHMETNMVEWMKEKHLLAPTTKLGNEYALEDDDDVIISKGTNGDHNIVFAVVVLFALYLLFLSVYLSVKFYRTQRVYQSIK